MDKPRGQILLTMFLGGLWSCGLAAQAKQTRPLLLAFDPPEGQVLEVRYHADETWSYDEGMRGKLTTELLLHWRFQPVEKSALIQATGTFQSVVYRGSGLKGGKTWSHDVCWNRKDGYLKGGDSEAVKKWIASEVKEGLHFSLDKRGAANPGEC